MSYKFDFDLEKANELRWDSNTSLFIDTIEQDTIDNKIHWYNSVDNLQKYEIANYYALYTFNGIKYSLVLSNDEFEGWFLRISEYNGKENVVLKEFDEWYYGTELKDLKSCVERKLGIVKSKAVSVYDYNGVPWNVPNKSETKWSATKHLTARGIKAEKKLKNVSFEYEMEVLGE